MTTGSAHAPFEGLAGLYAVGALNANDRRSFEKHIELCRSCVGEVMSLLPVAHVLTRAVPYHDPPFELRDRVIQAITGVSSAAKANDPTFKKISGTTDRPRRKGSRVGRVLFNLSAVLCLAIAGGLGWYASQQVNLARALQENLDVANNRAILAELQAATAQQVARESSQRADILAAEDLVMILLESQPAAPDARGRAYWSAGRGIVLTAMGLPPVPPGRTYHLWFVPATNPVSGGSLSLDNAGRIAATVHAPDGVTAPVPMAVTLEPNEAGAAPSGEVYFLGRPN